MDSTLTDFGDLTKNEYAKLMRYLANGLSSWSGFLLFFFYIYQIFSYQNARLFSLNSVALIVGGETAFLVLNLVANSALAAVFALLLIPVIRKGKIVIAQNIQNTWMAIFGLSLCIFAWFFAAFTSSYMFS